MNLFDFLNQSSSDHAGVIYTLAMGAVIDAVTLSMFNRDATEDEKEKITSSFNETMERDPSSSGYKSLDEFKELMIKNTLATAIDGGSSALELFTRNNANLMKLVAKLVSAYNYSGSVSPTELFESISRYKDKNFLRTVKSYENLLRDLKRFELNVTSVSVKIIALSIKSKTPYIHVEELLKSLDIILDFLKNDVQEQLKELKEDVHYFMSSNDFEYFYKKYLDHSVNGLDIESKQKQLVKVYTPPYDPHKLMVYISGLYGEILKHAENTKENLTKQFLGE